MILPAHGVGAPAELVADRYRLISRIHAGSAGVLYRAEDIAFARPVALRLLTPALSRDEAVLERLQARLRASATMSREDIGASGDIIDLTDLGRAESGQVFVVTDFLASESLAALIAREGPLPWRTLRPLMVRACQILHLSHQHDLLRLDLQTRHLFPVRDKTRTSTLKILSPGIGDVFGDSLWSALDPIVAAAHLRYAAPEQLTGGTVDPRTDVYALGIIMYEALCGRVPFPDARPAYVCARHLLEPPPPFPAAVRAAVPDAVVGIVSRALAKSPEERWPTMRALANAMAAIDFGPCDASGVLEVASVEPLAPNTSSASMRIDPAAGHAPSPAVRPRTMPPLQAVMAEPGLTIPGSTAIPPEPPLAPGAIDQRAQTYERWFTGPTEASASTSGSSSKMAWDEILAAAEEAVAAVARGPGSGNAGDSGVFIPESLLRSGLAATASTAHGRRSEPALDPGLSLAATVIMPTTLVRGATAPATPAPSASLELGDDVLGSAAELAAESSADLLGPSHRGAEPETAASLAPAAEESATSLRDIAARSASVWPLSAARSGAHPRPARARPLTWAAAAILAFGATAAALRLLRPGADEPAALSVAAPALPGPAAASPAPDLSPGTGAALPPAPPLPETRPDLSPGTAAPGLSSGTGEPGAPPEAGAPAASPGTPAPALPSGTAAPNLAFEPGFTSPAASQPSTLAPRSPAPPPTVPTAVPPRAPNLAPGTGPAQPARPGAAPRPRASDLPRETGSAPPRAPGSALPVAPPTRPPSADSPAAGAPIPRPAAPGAAAPGPEPPAGPRKSPPGAKLPDAGRDLLDPEDAAPPSAAPVPDRAGSAANPR